MFTDRTRMETYQICPRLRFLTFHYGGRGYVPVQEGYELVFGRLYHEALEKLSLGQDPRSTITTLSNQLLASINQLVTKPTLYYATEQQYLFEGLLWAWVRVKLPRLKNEYELVSTEKEFIWQLGLLPTGEPIFDMVRLDALIREYATESLYYKEYKTTAYGDDRWATQFEHNAQVMANLKATEESLGERPAAVIVEGHKKGNRRLDTARSSRVTGQMIQDSPLCFVYDQGQGNYSLKYAGNRSVRVPVWETGFPIKQWVNDFLTEQDCEDLFATPPPISPDPAHVDRWRRQAVAQETTIWGALELLADSTPDETAIILDRVFPLHETSCIRYGRKCSHYETCHNPTVGADPLASELYQVRTPHHAAEIALDGDSAFDNPAQSV
jgi:PD-(D/E)XK nuclease superfamily